MQNVLNNLDIKDFIIENIESLLSETNIKVIKQLNISSTYNLIIFYILSFKDFEKLENTFFYSLFNFKHFISMNAELFYFNNKINKLIEEFLLIKNINNSDIVNLYFKKYIEILVKISPDIIIDDIISNSLVYYDNKDKIYFKTSRFNNYHNIYDKPMCLNTDINNILNWIEYIILYKDISRSMLRMIFNKVIYLDLNNRSVIYRILKQIINLYKISDEFIKEYIKNNINTSNLTEINNELLTKKILKLKIKSKKIKLYNNLTNKQKKKRLYEDSINKQINIGKDNVYVLTNLIWEDIIYYLINIKNLKDDEEKEIIELVTTMIQNTDMFLKQRVLECKNFIENIRYNKKILDIAISNNF